jgi:lipoyl(octanoyl) transferase
MQMEKQFISREIEYSDLGLIDYQKAWDLQHQLFTKRLNNEISDTLLLLEHPHTYTLGKSSNKENLLLSEVELREQNISLYDIDRGGDITYHGPGQIVGYPIINLSLWKEDTHEYLRALEEVIIQTLAEYGIEGVRNEVHTGVWVNDKKICAIGIKVRSWITMHGFAFNVNTDMKLFNGIIPCGIENKGVTSLSEIKGETIELDGVKEIIFEKFKKILDYN